MALRLKLQRDRWEVWQGQDFFIDVVISDDADKAVSCVGFFGECQIRSKAKEEAALLATATVVLLSSAWTDSLGNPGWSARVTIPRDQTQLLTKAALPDLQALADVWIDNGLERQPVGKFGISVRQAVSEDV